MTAHVAAPSGTTTARRVVVPRVPVRGSAKRVRSGESEFVRRERVRAAGWKQTTDALPEPARAAAVYAGNGRRGRAVEHCLPVAFTEYSLLPEVRWPALALFAELGIAWHDAVPLGHGVSGPSNHLLASQVQCVNALGQMVTEPDRLLRAFGADLGIDEPLQVEPGRYLTFEFIGPTDFFGEGNGRARTRGARCTSTDAAFLHRHVDGAVELVLVEWKYTETYRLRSPGPRTQKERARRYLAAVDDPAGPIRTDVLPFDLLTDEPLYQRVRQQLLAHALERSHAVGADRVRVVNVAAPQNVALQHALTRPAHRAVGATVDEVWRALLRRPDRYLSLDGARFLDPEITSEDYRQRYGDAVIDCPSVLCAALGVWLPGDVGDVLCADHDLDADVTVHDAGVRFVIDGATTELAFPFTSAQLHGAAADLCPEAASPA